MDLNETSDESAFRAEARAWLEANVPTSPLPSFDTEEGFALHRVWEKKLYEGRWSAVSWPVEYGGRNADYIKWLIFEEEYYRAGAPGRVNQNGIFLLGPTIMEVKWPHQKWCGVKPGANPMPAATWQVFVVKRLAMVMTGF